MELLIINIFYLWPIFTKGLALIWNFFCTLACLPFNFLIILRLPTLLSSSELQWKRQNKITHTHGLVKIACVCKLVIGSALNFISQFKRWCCMSEWSLIFFLWPLVFTVAVENIWLQKLITYSQLHYLNNVASYCIKLECNSYILCVANYVDSWLQNVHFQEGTM